MAITWNIDEARATIQAQMDEANRLDGMIDAIAAERDAANAEVARLSHALGTWQQCGDAIMLCATGRAAPLSDSDVCGEIVRLRERVALEAEAKRTLAALRLAEQFVAKANADGAYTNTAMSGDRALAKINAALYGDSDQDAR